jgi:hypothetical protein
LSASPTSSTLQRLYRTKFALVAVVSSVTGIGLILLARWADAQPSAAWLRTWPMNEVGLGLFTTGLFGVLFHYVGYRDAEEEQLQRIRHVISGDLAARPDGLVTMLSSETRDCIVENCLRIQLGDAALARDLYTDLRAQIAGAGERRYDMDMSVALAPWPRGAASGKGAMFVATIRTEYRVAPVSPILRFACVSDLDEYRELPQDPTCTLVHYFQPVARARAPRRLRGGVRARRGHHQREDPPGAAHRAVRHAGARRDHRNRLGGSGPHGRHLVHLQGLAAAARASAAPRLPAPHEEPQGRVRLRRMRDPARQRRRLHRQQPATRTVAPAGVGTDAEHRAPLRRVDAAESRRGICMGAGTRGGISAGCRHGTTRGASAMGKRSAWLASVGARRDRIAAAPTTIARRRRTEI